MNATGKLEHPDVVARMEVPETVLNKTPSNPSGRSLRFSLRTPCATPSGWAVRNTWRERAMRNLHVDDAALLRGMPWSGLLQNFGRVLSQRSIDPRSYGYSAPVARIGTFVSHTWRTARWKKFLVLALHFNLLPALLLSGTVAAIVGALTACGLLPSVTLLSFGGAEYGRGLLAWPVGSVVFLLALLGFHEVDRLIPFTRHKVFLDCCCVHQSDLELKKKGIQSLAAFLNHSDQMLVIFSAAYMQRLWTCYEVITWLIVKGKNVTARPLFAAQLFFIVLFATSVFECLHLATSCIATEPAPLFILGPWYILLMFPSWTTVAWLASIWAHNLDLLASQVENFRLADAKCFSEADRVEVRKNIIAFMKFAKFVGEDEGESEVCQVFEELVRREVPRFLSSSFGRLGVPYLWPIVWGLPRLLVAVDGVAGDVVLGAPALTVALWFTFTCATVAGALPLLCALVFPMMRLHWLRNRLGSVCVGLMASSLNTMFQVPCTLLTTWAIESSFWLGVLLAFYALLALCTFLVYRPECCTCRPAATSEMGVDAKPSDIGCT